jgi:glyoxylase-like metal-dependent hydrolase (beta-lactamase superfamily II)
MYIDPFWAGFRLLCGPLRRGLREEPRRLKDAPGHPRGRVIYLSESDRVAVIGDLFNTMAMWTRRKRLSEPPAHVSVDSQEDRQ